MQMSQEIFSLFKNISMAIALVNKEDSTRAKVHIPIEGPNGTGAMLTIRKLTPSDRENGLPTMSFENCTPTHLYDPKTGKVVPNDP